MPTPDTFHPVGNQTLVHGTPTPKDSIPLHSKLGVELYPQGGQDLVGQEPEQVGMELEEQLQLEPELEPELQSNLELDLHQ